MKIHSGWQHLISRLNSRAGLSTCGPNLKVNLSPTYAYYLTNSKEDTRMVYIKNIFDKVPK